MEYLRKFMQDTVNGKILVDNRFKFSFISRSVSLVHFILIFLFLWLGVYPLVIFNIISSLLYYLLVIFIKKGKYIAAFNFTYGEIFIHTFIANLLVGYRFGFQLYTLALVPVSFYVAFTLEQFKQRILIPVCYTLLSMVVFVGCRIWDIFVGSVYVIDDIQAETIIYIFNAVVSYVMMMVFAILFLLEIHQFQQKLRQANSKLEYLVGVDPLTGLLNRRKFFEQVRERKEDITFILLCDVDDFKKVNDTYGHECGDILLVEIARIFEKNFPDPNMVCRWGGEEICIAGMGNREAVLQRAERLRKEVEELKVMYEDSTVQVTITVGVAECKGYGDLKKAISEADKKMYEGKQNGKNCVVI